MSEMNICELQNQRDENLELTPFALACAVLADMECDCSTDEPGTCEACLIEDAFRFLCAQRDEYKAMFNKAMESERTLGISSSREQWTEYFRLKAAQNRPPLIKAELGCMTCRNNTTVDYCADCKLRDGDNGSKWQPIQHEGETHE
jgi:hypothetical protein